MLRWGGDAEDGRGLGLCARCGRGEAEEGRERAGEESLEDGLLHESKLKYLRRLHDLCRKGGEPHPSFINVACVPKAGHMLPLLLRQDDFTSPFLLEQTFIYAAFASFAAFGRAGGASS
eukprot:1149364-Pelagomonas_calceolata.AAC.6